jgi:hypothetical protein
MKRLVEIRFRRSGKIFDYDARNLDLEIGEKVMVEWEDGLKMGIILKEVYLLLHFRWKGRFQKSGKNSSK